MCWCICVRLQFGWSDPYVNTIRTVRMTYIHCGPCVDFYLSEPNDLLRINQLTGMSLTGMLSVQSELRYAPYESQAEWSDSVCSANFSNILENVPNPPVPSRTPPSRHAPYTRYESNSPNFPESMREGWFLKIRLLLHTGVLARFLNGYYWTTICPSPKYHRLQKEPSRTYFKRSILYNIHNNYFSYQPLDGWHRRRSQAKTGRQQSWLWQIFSDDTNETQTVLSGNKT